MRRLALLIFAVSLLAAPATANAAIDGGLKQLGGTAGCIVDEGSPPAGCVDVRGMTDVGKMAISPDGKNVYVPSRGRNALAVFTRNTTTGTLSQRPGALGCYTANSTIASEDTCTLIASGLAAVAAVVVSANGGHVYAAGSGGSVTHFTRNSTGDLTFLGTGGGSGGTPGTTQLAISPDGQSLYASDLNQPGGLVMVYRLGGAGAGITFRQCFASASTSYGCGAGLITNGYVDEPSDLVVTPDGKQLLLANGNDTGTDFSTGSVVGFTRTTSGANLGDLTAPTAASCISGNALAGCTQRPGVYYMRGLSPISNSQIYAAGYYGVFRISRNASTNALSISPNSNACRSYEGNSYSCDTLNPNASRVFTTRDVIVTPDGKNLYAENENGTAATIHSLSRGSTGTFAPLPAPLQCLSVDGGTGCNRTLTGGTGNTTNNLIASPTGRNVYAAGGNRLFSFTRDRAPVCQNINVNTAHNTAVAIGLSCSDPDGDAVTYQKLTDPVRGTVGGIQGNSISYGPQLGTSGADSFQYRATSTGAASDPATVTVNVAAPPAPPSGGGGGGGTPPPQLIPSTVTNNWLAFPAGFTKVTNLSVNNLLAATTVRVTCKTKKKKKQKKGCPYKSKRFTTSGARAKLNLLKPFKKKKLPAGTKITISVTVPGQIGKRFQYTMRKGKIPKKQLRCISPAGKVSTCS